MRLSDFEVEVMQLFWQQERLSAPEAHERLGERKGVTYSTIKTIIDRLEQKAALVRGAKEGRTIYYQAKVKPEDIQKPMLRSFIDKVFGGKRNSLFVHLIEDEKLNSDDIAYLEKLIKDKKKQLKDK
ncbi:MAG: BlaI/MecI/CopY family transcriptional regulator [Gammaproteobacteria bacterium]|nr:BlaI/MecI/CopY family transcriptional regulator [Gammaproteobacteria bacterium]